MNDDTDFPTCKTCDYARPAVGPADLLFCREGVTAPLGLQRQWGASQHHDEFVTPDFGCILHSALQDQQDDE